MPSVSPPAEDQGLEIALSARMYEMDLSAFRFAPPASTATMVFVSLAIPTVFTAVLVHRTPSVAEAVGLVKRLS